MLSRTNQIRTMFDETFWLKEQSLKPIKDEFELLLDQVKTASSMAFFLTEYSPQYSNCSSLHGAHGEPRWTTTLTESVFGQDILIHGFLVVMADEFLKIRL